MQPEKQIPLLDSILDEWKQTIGKDFEGYKNHVYRMVNFCFALNPCSAEEREKIVIAAAFHDIGLWADNTLDYIPPSILPAIEYLKRRGLENWTNEISLMISEHHKVRQYAGPFPLVEIFRKADLVDFSLGMVTFGLPVAYINQVKAEMPNAGFHANLIRLAAKWFVKHPLNPAPMMKW
jgi:hypothetical protein